MIIDLRFDSLHYEKEFLKHTKELSFICPACKENHTFICHGSYERNVVRWNGWIQEKKIRILRIKCTSCNHTQAVLPWDVIPYKIYSISYYWKLLRLLGVKQAKVSECSEVMDLSIKQVYHVIRDWINWKELMEELRVENMKWIHRVKNKKSWNQFRYYTTQFVNSQNV